MANVDHIVVDARSGGMVSAGHEGAREGQAHPSPCSTSMLSMEDAQYALHK